MSYLYQNSIIPFTWKELQAGFQYLQKEKLTLPEYKVILGQIPSCSVFRCYLHKLNLLPGYDSATFLPFTVPLVTDFFDAFICPNHLLSREPYHLLANSSHEIDYLYAATSLVKLKSYEFNIESKSLVEKKPHNSIFKVINVPLNLEKVIKKIKKVVVNKFIDILDKERVDLVEKAMQGTCSTLVELKIALAYLIEMEERNNKERFEILSILVSEFINLYSTYNVYYRSFKSEPKPIEDFAFLNNRFNQHVSSLVSDIDKVAKKELGINELSSIFHVLQKNYLNVEKSFAKNIDAFEDIILSLKAEPNHNNLFNQYYSHLEPIYLFIYLQNNLFPQGEVLFKQGKGSTGQSKALYKISFREFINLYLFYDAILDSNIYFKKDESKVMDATILWSKDHNSPLYIFDEAYDITCKI